MISAVSYAQGRKPAVEDFVGIEVEESDVAPQGSEALYNLQQDISKIEDKHKEPAKAPELTKPSEPTVTPTFIFGIALALGLPLTVWFLMMAHLKKKATAESASNIEVLEKYRRDREKKSDENIRKVS
jgi:hypothetical protein